MASRRRRESEVRHCVNGMSQKVPLSTFGAGRGVSGRRRGDAEEDPDHSKF